MFRLDRGHLGADPRIKLKSGEDAFGIARRQLKKGKTPGVRWEIEKVLGVLLTPSEK